MILMDKDISTVSVFTFKQFTLFIEAHFTFIYSVCSLISLLFLLSLLFTPAPSAGSLYVKFMTSPRALPLSSSSSVF